MKLPSEAIVVVGDSLTRYGGLNHPTKERMDTAMVARAEHAIPRMVISGNRPFWQFQKTPVATVMAAYAQKAGVSDNEIFVEDQSLDTIGNALFTKTQIVQPHQWEKLLLVTSRSHMLRATQVFRHVYGSDFDIQAQPTNEPVTYQSKGYELLGNRIVQAVLRGTKPGDDEAIQERLFDLVPGYAAASLARLIGRIIVAPRTH